MTYECSFGHSDNSSALIFPTQLLISCSVCIETTFEPSKKLWKICYQINFDFIHKNISYHLWERRKSEVKVKFKQKRSSLIFYAFLVVLNSTWTDITRNKKKRENIENVPRNMKIRKKIWTFFFVFCLFEFKDKISLSYGIVSHLLVHSMASAVRQKVRKCS